MVRLAVAGNPAFAVSDIELRRPGVSYTVDTVRALREKLGAGAQIYFLIGMDTVAELAAWREVARLARLCKFVPLSRPGHANPNAAALERAVGRLPARAILKRARRHAADRDLLVRNPPPRRGGPDDPLPRPRSRRRLHPPKTPLRDGFVSRKRGARSCKRLVDSTCHPASCAHCSTLFVTSPAPWPPRRCCAAASPRSSGRRRRARA